MFRAKTVLVLGAGASFEIDLPLGTELLSRIAKLLEFKFEFGSRPKSGDNCLFEALKHVVDEGREVEKTNAHLNAGRHLIAAASQAKSIDAVIDALEDEQVETMGKLAIVRAILKAEQTSSFFAGDRGRPGAIDVTRFSNAWHARLASLLFEGRKATEVDSIFENLEVINFNYDRTLETFLLHSISGFYGLRLDAVHPIVATLPMHRPYGTVGRLPWIDGGGQAIPFGEGRSEQIAEAYKQVRTFTERVDEGEELSAIKHSIATADRIVFLGFGFHRQNIKLIAAETQPHCEVLGTAKGLSPDDKEMVLEELRTQFEINAKHDARSIKLPDLGCAEFFDQFGRRLSSDPAAFVEAAG